jgi:hypothetical protein
MPGCKIHQDIFNSLINLPGLGWPVRWRPVRFGEYLKYLKCLKYLEFMEEMSYACPTLKNERAGRNGGVEEWSDGGMEEC